MADLELGVEDLGGIPYAEFVKSESSNRTVGKMHQGDSPHAIRSEEPVLKR
jgi:hypothetical protein